MAMEEAKEEPITDRHVLLVAFSAQGHINPMLRLGKRLLSKGLHVTFATTEFAGHRMLKSSFSPTAVVSGIHLRFFSDGFPLDYDRKASLDHYMDTLAASGPDNLSHLIETNLPAATGRLSCIITNPFVPWAADVAAAHGVPCALLWIQPSALYSIYYRFYNKLNPFPTPQNPDAHVTLPGLPTLQTRDLPSFVLPSNTFGSFPKLFSGMFPNLKSNFTWVLGNTFHALEKDVTESMTDILAVTPVGPLVPPALLDQDESLDIGIDMWSHDGSAVDWLDRQENNSVVYVSFGSITVLSRNQMESIATALKKIDGPFLWVVKPPEGPAAGGAGEVPEGFLEETKGKGLVVPWCPQTKVLAHPAVACFLTHCGWNSMLESIAAGVPVIGYPQWTDQPTNAKLITDVFKVGLRIGGSDGSISSEEVVRCIEEMKGVRYEEFKSNAAELKGAAAEAVAEGGSSDRNVQRFVDEISGKSCGGDEEKTKR